MRSPLVNQEMLLLNYLAEHAPISIGEMAESFGKAQGLARTTVLTMMERLRRKGQLTREKVDGIYLYRPSVSRAELQRGLVDDFYRLVLGGSLEPFVSYLSHDARLSKKEVDTLRTLVEQLDRQEKG